MLYLRSLNLYHSLSSISDISVSVSISSISSAIFSFLVGGAVSSLTLRVRALSLHCVDRKSIMNSILSTILYKSSKFSIGLYSKRGGSSS